MPTILTKSNIQKIGAILAVALTSGGGVTLIGNQRADEVNAKVAVLESWQDDHTIEDREDRVNDREERKALLEKLDHMNEVLTDVRIQVSAINARQGVRTASVKTDTMDGTEVKTANYAYYNEKEK